MKHHPPLVGICFTIRPGRRRGAASTACRGSPERRRAGLPIWDDLPCSVSLLGDRKRREASGGVVIGHQPPARRGRDTRRRRRRRPVWFFWEGLRSPPAPAWRISSCARAAGCAPPPAMGTQTRRPRSSLTRAACTGHADTRYPPPPRRHSGVHPAVPGVRRGTQEVGASSPATACAHLRREAGRPATSLLGPMDALPNSQS